MATDLKHTPGPWIALPLQVRDHGGRNPIFKNGIWWVLPETDQERCPIAIADTGDDHDEQTRINSEADARLIAAAPELLAELIRVEETAIALGLSSMAKTVRAAIARATGAQS